jgi:putative ABC transport system ATP-binding protein
LRRSPRKPASARRFLVGEVLVLEDVWKAFDRGRDRVPVLEGVSLSVAEREIVAVVGTRDQGKTTLIRVASGMLPADWGSVRVAGLELTGLSDRELARVLATDVGVAARGGPEARLQVRDYVGLSLAAGRRWRWRERRLRVAEVLKALDVAGCADLRWEDLSSWQRVLVEFAQAIVVKPRVLLVDDVVDGLGLGKKQAAMELLQGFAKDLGCGVLMAVSDHAAALKSIRVSQLSGGHLKLMADHTDPDVIQLHKRRDGGRIRSAGS